MNCKIVDKSRTRNFLRDAVMEPKAPHSTVLTADQEAMVVAFRKHTLFPLDVSLYASLTMVLHMTRSALHRCQLSQPSRLPVLAWAIAA